jgi:hypothetical protein
VTDNSQQFTKYSRDFSRKIIQSDLQGIHEIYNLKQYKKNPKSFLEEKI